MYFFWFKKIFTHKYLQILVLEVFWRVVSQDAIYGTSFLKFFFALIHPRNQSKYKYKLQ